MEMYGDVWKCVEIRGNVHDGQRHNTALEILSISNPSDANRPLRNAVQTITRRGGTLCLGRVRHQLAKRTLGPGHISLNGRPTSLEQYCDVMQRLGCCKADYIIQNELRGAVRLPRDRYCNIICTGRYAGALRGKSQPRRL